MPEVTSLLVAVLSPVKLAVEVSQDFCRSLSLSGVCLFNSVQTTGTVKISEFTRDMCCMDWPWFGSVTVSGWNSSSGSVPAVPLGKGVFLCFNTINRERRFQFPFLVRPPKR